MTDKKWNKEEHDEVMRIRAQNEWIGMHAAYEQQKKLFDECKDPVQKLRYGRGLVILQRNLVNSKQDQESK